MTDPREHGLSSDDLRRAADALYAPGDSRLWPVGVDHTDQVEAGRLRRRLRCLADAVDDEEAP